MEKLDCWKYSSGSVSFIFGAITFIFFILIQMRVYRAYSNDVQVNNPSEKNFCQATLIRGALAMIILIYISILLFISVTLLILDNTWKKREEKKERDMEMVVTNAVHRL